MEKSETDDIALLKQVVIQLEHRVGMLENRWRHKRAPAAATNVTLRTTTAADTSGLSPPLPHSEAAPHLVPLETALLELQDHPAGSHVRKPPTLRGKLRAHSGTRIGLYWLNRLGIANPLCWVWCS